MAHKASLSYEVKQSMDIGGDVKHYWNIDKAVGWECKNDWDDVLLIQYFLNSINGANLVEDGIFGKKTYKAIRAFQKGKGFVDGKIDVATNADGYVYNSTQTIISVYAIYTLNLSYYKKHQVFYEDLRMDNKLPSELCQIFSSWKNN